MENGGVLVADVSAGLGGVRPPGLGLDLAGRRVVVFGGEAPVLRYLGSLLHADARVKVVAPTVCPSVAAMVTAGRLRWESRDWREDDLDDAWYAVACTGTDDDRIATAAERRRVFCAQATTAPADVQRPGPGVALVGAGPGDPGLITVRGLELLRAADTVVVDRLAPVELLTEVRQDAEIIDAAKIPYGRAAAQRDLNEVLVSRAHAGKFVVRLKGGDSYVFGRGFEELAACAAAGVAVAVVPGISSALAVPALAGVPVTHRGLTHDVTIVSGHLAPGHKDSLLDWPALARLTGTLVILMGVTHIAATAETLLRAGKDPETPALVVQEGTTRAQRVLRSTLARLGKDCRAAQVGPPAVFVIGAVAGLNVNRARLDAATE